MYMKSDLHLYTKFHVFSPSSNKKCIHFSCDWFISIGGGDDPPLEGGKEVHQHEV